MSDKAVIGSDVDTMETATIISNLLKVSIQLDRIGQTSKCEILKKIVSDLLLDKLCKSDTPMPCEYNIKQKVEPLQGEFHAEMRRRMKENYDNGGKARKQLAYYFKKCKIDETFFNGEELEHDEKILRIREHIRNTDKKQGLY